RTPRSGKGKEERDVGADLGRDRGEFGWGEVQLPEVVQAENRGGGVGRPSGQPRLSRDPLRESHRGAEIGAASPQLLRGLVDEILRTGRKPWWVAFQFDRAG